MRGDRFGRVSRGFWAKSGHFGKFEFTITSDYGKRAGHTAPLERLLELVDGFRYSTGDEPDPLSATARTPCWCERTE
jgi:hypothetical protein